MNKKGFTLVEILVTLSLIALISVIVIPSIVTFNKRLKSKENETTKKLILKAADTYVLDKKDNLFATAENNYTNYCIDINLQKIINDGYYDPKEDLKEKLEINDYEDYKLLAIYKNNAVQVLKLEEGDESTWNGTSVGNDFRNESLPNGKCTKLSE